MTSRHAFLFAGLAALAGCSPAAGSPGGVEAGIEAGVEGDSGLAIIPVSDGAAPPVGDGGGPSSGLGFAASNLPPGPLSANADWILSPETCTTMTPTIDVVEPSHNTGCASQMYNQLYQVVPQDAGLTIGVYVTRKFTIAAGMHVTVTGANPLLIVALGDVDISGTLTLPPLGSAFAGGMPGMPKSAPNGAGQGGAAGAGFCALGGPGRDPAGAGVPGGAAYGDPTNVPLLTGSLGGVGRQGDSAGGAGNAFELVSATKISVSATGVVDVGGGGGAVDFSIPSGAGGGSGGAILLEAPIVSVAGVLAANGGGGAESGSTNAGQDGQPSAVPATGGAASSATDNAGGAGGAGSAPAGAPSPMTVATAPGGGGGGSAGRIRINTAGGSATIASSAVISPAVGSPCTTQGAL